MVKEVGSSEVISDLDTSKLQHLFNQDGNSAVISQIKAKHNITD
jgi:hypothetical protein